MKVSREWVEVTRRCCPCRWHDEDWSRPYSSQDPSFLSSFPLLAMSLATHCWLCGAGYPQCSEELVQAEFWRYSAVFVENGALWAGGSLVWYPMASTCMCEFLVGIAVNKKTHSELSLASIDADWDTNAFFFFLRCSLFTFSCTTGNRGLS